MVAIVEAARQKPEREDQTHDEAPVDDPGKLKKDAMGVE